MDIILLPVLERMTLPSRVLEVMKASRRSVAVVIGSSPQGLITSREVRKAKNQEWKNFAQAELEPLAIMFPGEFVSAGYAALRLPYSSFPLIREHLMQTFPGMAHRQLNIPLGDLSYFEQLLPPNSMHGFLGYDRGAAVVMTRHETLAARASGPPPDCCCGNPQDPHEYPGGRKKTGQTCDVCAYIIEC